MAISAEVLRRRFGGFISRLKQRRRRGEAEHALARSRLIDPAWYRATYRLDARSDPVEHYLAGPQDRRPSPWFDAAWYLARYPDVVRAGLHPLVHYVLYGAREGRNPNSHFATRWYLDSNPEASGSATPLDHYVAVGASRQADPSPDFDAAWYVANEMGEDGGGLDPLAHYLLIGRARGARTLPFRPTARGEPVELARLEAFKPLPREGRQPLAVITATASDGGLSSECRTVVERLAARGMRVVLMVETRRPFAPDSALLKLLSAGYVREARGHRYAGIAHLLRGEPLLFAGEALLLINGDAVSAEAAVAVLRRVRASPADVLAPPCAAVDGNLLDSDLLAFKGRALASPTLHMFFSGWRSDDRDEPRIRASFERQLTTSLLKADLAIERLARFETGDGRASPGSSSVEATDADASPEETVVGSLIDAGFTAPLSEPLKISLIGPLNYATGLSKATRGYVSALWRAGVRLNIYPIESPFHVHRRIAPTVAVRDFEGAADAAIVHLNPHMWNMLTTAQLAVIEHARLRVGIWVWEMGHVPESWLPGFDRVDEIWTPSRYCAEVLAAQTTKPVRVVPHVVSTPPLGDVDRKAVLRGLGLEPHARIILYAFDAASFILRKNPQALIEAFVMSGLQARGWRLVLKTKNLMDQPREGAALARLAARSEGVLLLEKDLDQEALTALFEVADVYASPHRSEGFGLTVAEAMALGKPVVASDFGGVRDFLDASCGFPVPVQVIENDQPTEAYPRGGRWAEVDVADFAAALSSCAGLVEAGETGMGDQARRRIAERLSADAVAKLMNDALEPGVSFARRQASAA